MFGWLSGKKPLISFNGGGSWWAMCGVDRLKHIQASGIIMSCPASQLHICLKLNANEA